MNFTCLQTHKLPKKQKQNKKNETKFCQCALVQQNKSVPISGAHFPNRPLSCLQIPHLACAVTVYTFRAQTTLQSIVFFSYFSICAPVQNFRYKHQDEDLLPNADTIALSPHKIKCHHPNCPKMNQNSPHTEQRHSQKVQTGETSSICGSIIIQGNCNGSQLSSPDVSETTETRKYLSAINLCGNEDRTDDKQKTILLKIPGVIKADQLVVSVRPARVLTVPTPPYPTRR